jgi:hypothetical protein
VEVLTSDGAVVESYEQLDANAAANIVIGALMEGLSIISDLASLAEADVEDVSFSLLAKLWLWCRPCSVP